ncbi:MAG: hypothetical protein Kow00124_29900 [Anaerolineae bacterium]
MEQHHEAAPRIRVGYPPRRIHTHLSPGPAPMVWDRQIQITNRLLMWSLLSILGGAGLILSRVPLLRGIGVQAAAWGAIDAAIAVIGQRASNIRLARPDALEPDTLARERRNLVRALLINTGLDVFYVLGGALLTSTKGRQNEQARGHGIGVMVQGGFLFLFDLYHALLLTHEGRTRP